MAVGWWLKMYYSIYIYNNSVSVGQAESLEKSLPQHTHTQVYLQAQSLASNIFIHMHIYIRIYARLTLTSHLYTQTIHALLPSGLK